MRLVIGADSAGKPLLDVIAKHLAAKGLDVTDLSPSSGSTPEFYADTAERVGRSITRRRVRARHPVLRHRHRRLHLGQQGAGNPGGADPRHLFGREGRHQQQRPDHHPRGAGGGPGAGQVDRRHLARLAIRCARVVGRQCRGHRQARREIFEDRLRPRGGLRLPGPFARIDSPCGCRTRRFADEPSRSGRSPASMRAAIGVGIVGARSHPDRPMVAARRADQAPASHAADGISLPRHAGSAMRAARRPA